VCASNLAAVDIGRLAEIASICRSKFWSPFCDSSEEVCKLYLTLCSLFLGAENGRDVQCNVCERGGIRVGADSGCSDDVGRGVVGVLGDRHVDEVCEALPLGGLVCTCSDSVGGHSGSRDVPERNPHSVVGLAPVHAGGGGGSLVGVGAEGLVPAAASTQSGVQPLVGKHHAKNKRKKELARLRKASADPRFVVPKVEIVSPGVDGVRKGFFSECPEEVQRRLRVSRAECLIAENTRKTMEHRARVSELKSETYFVEQVVAATERAERLSKRAHDSKVHGWAAEVFSKKALSDASGAPSTIPSFATFKSSKSVDGTVRAKPKSAPSTMTGLGAIIWEIENAKNIYQLDGIKEKLRVLDTDPKRRVDVARMLGVRYRELNTYNVG